MPKRRRTILERLQIDDARCDHKQAGMSHFRDIDLRQSNAVLHVFQNAAGILDTKLGVRREIDHRHGQRDRQRRVLRNLQSLSDTNDRLVRLGDPERQCPGRPA
ncbi:MAG: hypothetical protein FD138_3663, partial [Planctomycetota bacterium]